MAKIETEERDYFLDLHRRSWPQGLRVPGWQTLYQDDKRHLRREVDVTLGPGHVCRLAEHILRFPSAPIYRIHRQKEYQLKLQSRLNYHTLRLLRSIDDAEIQRIFVIHNGLNENDDLTFYHRFAAEVINADPRAAFIVRPFPGHLSRHPFPREFAENPLDRYLSDAGDLVRQFLRFMLESQWLLSAIVPLGSYKTVAGVDLLAESCPGRPGRGQADPSELAAAIHREWEEAYDSNAIAPPVEGGERVTADEIAEIVLTLRGLVGWRTDAPYPRGESATHDQFPPAIHVVGYSLGGFLAQAVLFTWPFAVGTCTTICSGGALRDVALTAFAHPEEWQSVLHALRYEIESSMLEQRFVRTGEGTVDERIAGINLNFFAFFLRIFYDVFLQDSAGFYRSRVEEYIDRLLFVVGGRDPIVSTRSVMEATPEGGVNLIEVANLSHFPKGGPRGWQEFWLPEVSRVLDRFAVQGENLLARSLARCHWKDDKTDVHDAHHQKWNSELLDGDDEYRPQIPEPGGRRRDPETGDEALDSEQFQIELARIAESLGKGGGHAIIARNHVPIALMGSKVLHRRGTMLHHEEEKIRSYFQGLRWRDRELWKGREHVSLIVPAALEQWMLDKEPVLSPHPEAAAFRVPSADLAREIWSEFYTKWQAAGALRLFDPAASAARELALSPGAGALLRAARSELRIPERFPLANTLPDVWIWLSRDLIARELVGGSRLSSRDNVCSAILEVAEGIVQARKRQRELSREARRLGRAPVEVEYLRNFRGWLLHGLLKIVKVSRSEFNPKFMGWYVRDPWRAQSYFVHTALALVYSHAAPPAVPTSDTFQI